MNIRSGVTAVLRYMSLDPLQHGGNVLGTTVPGGARFALHQNADHAVLRREAPDVVVERVGGFILDFNLVARAAGHIDQHGALPRALCPDEYIHHVLRILPE